MPGERLAGLWRAGAPIRAVVFVTHDRDFTGVDVLRVMTG
jgi:hypothetical protein